MSDEPCYNQEWSPEASVVPASVTCQMLAITRVAALVNGIVSGHLCGSASTVVDVRDEKVQR